jgi:thiamine pyrophosphokinase
MSDMHALIFTGGPFPLFDLPLPEAQLIIAADSGGDHAEELGLEVDLIIGDFDSCSKEAIEKAKEVRRFPTDKDVTDLELALAAAIEKNVSSVTIITSARGRFDHIFGNIFVASSNRWRDLEIDLFADGSYTKVIRNKATLTGKPSDPLTLFAMGGTAFGITSNGLKWELDGIDLSFASGLGISNEFLAHEVEILIDEGTIISIQSFDSY